MMEAFTAQLYAIVLKLAVLSIIGSVLEYMLPQGGVKNSASRVIGIVMLISIAEPIINALYA